MSTNASRALASGGAQRRDGQTCPTCHQPWQHRSDADHRMFWSVLEIAHSSWPEAHEFQPLGKMHLYGWLLCEAGWHEPPIEIESRNPEFVKSILMAVFPAMKSKLHCIRFIPTAKGVRVLVPKSLDYKTAGKRPFEDTRSKVYEIVEATLGVPIETLKSEARAA